MTISGPLNLLRLLQRFSREPSAVAAVAQNFAVRVGLIVITFGTGIVAARSLAPLGRGEQAALILWPVLLAGLSTVGISTSVNYLSRRRPDDAGRLLFAALVIALVTGVFATVVGIGAMPLLLHGYDAHAINNARWLMLFAPQLLTQLVVRAHFESSGEYTRSILGQLFPNVFTLAGLVALRSFDCLTPMSAVLCYYIPGAAWTLWSIALLWPRMQVGFDILRADSSALLSYGVRSYGTDIINSLSAQIDLAVIVAFLNPVALGLYSVSLTVARLLNIVQQSLVTVMFPHASTLDHESAIELIGRGARVSTVIAFSLGLLLLIVVPFALPLVYGPEFVDALKIIPLLIVEAILAGTATVLLQAFLCTGRPAIVSVVQVGWMVTALLLLLLLVPRMQTAGAAVALLSASVVRIGLIAAAYKIALRRNLPRLIPNSADFAYVRNKIRDLSPRHEAITGSPIKSGG